MAPGPPKSTIVPKQEGEPKQTAHAIIVPYKEVQDWKVQISFT